MRGQGLSRRALYGLAALLKKFGRIKRHIRALPGGFLKPLFGCHVSTGRKLIGGDTAHRPVWAGHHTSNPPPAARRGARGREILAFAFFGPTTRLTTALFAAASPFLPNIDAHFVKDLRVFISLTGRRPQVRALHRPSIFSRGCQHHGPTDAGLVTWIVT